MATAGTERDVHVVGEDEFIPERLLGQIAHRVCPQHLKRFATTILNVEDAKYFQLIDGTENDVWKRCHRVSYHMWISI